MEIQPWHKELPSGEFVREWQLPEGKDFFDYFGRDRPGSVQGLPRLPHHRTGKTVNLCLRFQFKKGGCRRGFWCDMAHVKPSSMTREVKDKITTHLANVYSGGNGGGAP